MEYAANIKVTVLTSKKEIVVEIDKPGKVFVTIMGTENYVACEKSHLRNLVSNCEDGHFEMRVYEDGFKIVEGNY